jgi:gamma-glutamyltranspeptidase / glutathione hydrolase
LTGRAAGATPSGTWLALFCALLLGVSCQGAPTGAPEGAAGGTAGAEAAPAPPVLAEGESATFAHYAVAADHPQASLAGAEVLAAGGNAADAAVATMLALGVASPASSGLGGGGFALYHHAASGRTMFVDFRETAPAAATPDMFQVASEGPGGDEAGTPEPTAGLSAGVPGEPRGMVHLLDRYGSMSRAEVAAPAIRLAEEGFAPGDRVTALMARFAGGLAEDAVGRAWLGDDGEVPGPDDTLTNPALAQTLRTFVEEGDAPFYQGDLARQIVAAVRAEGGRITAEDLVAYQVHERAALEGTAFGHRWITAPPESAGGYTLLAALGLLERWRPGADAPPWTEGELLHAFAEAVRGPFIDRRRYFGDPRFLDVPVARLLAPERTRARAAVFDAGKARNPVAYDLPLDGGQGPSGAATPGRGTSHLCVVDAEGNVASVTTTVNWPFGIRRSVGGFFINNELDDFTKDPAQAGNVSWKGADVNVARAGRRPVSSMTPTLVLDGAGRPVLCLGGSGGTRIVTSALQVGYRVVVLGQDPGAAIAVPRIHASEEPGVHVEADLPAALGEDLRARGHGILPMMYGASVQAIRIVRPSPESGGGQRMLQAASDARKGGRPAGR